jgi:hypothetical protein
MKIRDRVKELRRVRAGDLRPNPRNWRAHPPAQQDALRGILAEVGFAGALLARELADGSLELIDGHLRAETTPGEMLPVLVLDVTEAEAAKILATHDPLAAMARADTHRLDALLREVQTGNEALAQMLADLAAESGVTPVEMPPPEVEEKRPAEEESAAVPEMYQVLAECRDEAEQKRVYDWLTGEGVPCRVLTL